MIGFDGRHQWRQHQAIQALCQTTAMQNLDIFQRFMAVAQIFCSAESARKICDSLIY
jgi:hypothetical protein